MTPENTMKKIRIEKITLNIGVGKDQSLLEKGVKLLKNITGIAPVKTYAKKRIPAWGLRPGLPIGCKITLRGKEAEVLLIRLIKSKDNILRESCFDEHGNIAFGIHEYIDIPGVNYDVEVGIIGLQVCITLERPGYRIKRRRYQQKDIGKNHLISKQDSIEFMKEKFGIQIGESEEQRGRGA